VTADSLERTAMTRATLARGRSRDGFSDRDAFIASLDIVLDCRTLQAGEDTSRVAELLQRTTQFTTTGLQISAAELSRRLAVSEVSVHVARASDRFGDHGVVGAIVVEHGEIAAFAVSCRALGMDIEHRFLAYAVQAAGAPLRGRIVETERNFPARNIYRDNGFVLNADGVWCAG
jgi:FkbH-like protein